MNREKLLVYKFMELPYVHKMDIMARLGILPNGSYHNDNERWLHFFKLAKEQNLLADLWNAVCEASEEASINPFRENVSMPRLSGVYRHYKGGSYSILFEAVSADNEDDRDAVVVYVSLTTGQIYTRKKKEFLAEVDGKPRFDYVSETVGPPIKV